MQPTVIWTSPLGKIGLTFKQNKLAHVALLPDDAPLIACSDMFALSIIEELKAYFDNSLHTFTIALHLEGTPFQQSVWKALLTLPPGETLTYGQLAKRLDTSPRAIGQACRSNPIPIIIPCHRIVAAEGLGGYSGNKKGRFTAIKHWLLQHEGRSLPPLPY